MKPVSRLSKKLLQLKHNKQKAFIPFITAGDPDLKTTENLILALDQCGVSAIELGMPFTDPMADGPAIQKSSERALAHGTNLKKILQLITKVRSKTQIPILLMGYYNPIFQFGLKKFCIEAQEAGVDGLLIVDLPVEEAEPLRTELKNKLIDLIYLLTPTSTDERINLVQKHGSGFVYYVSMTGVTGSQNLNVSNVQKQVRHLKKFLNLPINVGFGISTPDQVKQLSSLADGVVVGSALVKVIEKYKERSVPFLKRSVMQLMKPLR